MNIPDNIFLVGPMGAGKSTVGRQLARALGKDFVDCDREIEIRTGASISLIFELEGEEGFRRREQAMLLELTERDGIVLATGGGAVLEAENRARLRARGYAIYLKATVDLLVERTARDRNRPLLQTDDPRARLESLLAEREPLYEQVADMTVKTNHRTARHVVREIVRRIEAE
jgi:shikimate kinase